MVSRLFLILGFSLPAFAVEQQTLPAKTVPSNVEAVSSIQRGVFLNPKINFDVSQYSSNSAPGGIGFSGGALMQYYFAPHVGLFVGGSFSRRRMNINPESAVTFIDIPLGLAFQYTLGGGEMVSVIGLGVYESIPITSLSDVALQSVTGLTAEFESYFPVAPGFQLGLDGSVRFGFSSPTSAAGLTLGVQLGLGARFAL